MTLRQEMVNMVGVIAAKKAQASSSAVDVRMVEEICSELVSIQNHRRLGNLLDSFEGRQWSRFAGDCVRHAGEHMRLSAFAAQRNAQREADAAVEAAAPQAAVAQPDRTDPSTTKRLLGNLTSPAEVPADYVDAAAMTVRQLRDRLDEIMRQRPETADLPVLSRARFGAAGQAQEMRVDVVRFAMGGTTTTTTDAGETFRGVELVAHQVAARK